MEIVGFPCLIETGNSKPDQEVKPKPQEMKLQPQWQLWMLNNLKDSTKDTKYISTFTFMHKES